MGASNDILTIGVIEERYGRYDAAHGTPDPMVRRVLTFRAGDAEARFEQTDYGHPGRFNAWEPRGIDARLQPRTEELRDLCARISALTA